MSFLHALPSLLWALCAYLIAVSVLVTAHEFGHYWVARRCGVKVLVFSIGFGKPLLHWRRGTEIWQIAAIPLGGYVRMLDEREKPVPTELLPYAFNRQMLWKRMLIVLAGPAANAVLAVLFFFVVFLLGVEQLRPVIGGVIPDTPAARAGLQPGDTVQQVGRRPVEDWSSLGLALADPLIVGQSVDLPLRVRSADGAERELHLRWEYDEVSLDSTDWLQQIGLLQVPQTLVLEHIAPGSPAERAGLRTGDRIVQLEKTPVIHWFDFTRRLQLRGTQPTQIQLERNHQLLDFTLTPEAFTLPSGRRVGRIGASPRVDHEAWLAMREQHHYSPLEAFPRAVRAVWNASVLPLRYLGNLVFGQASPRYLSGPISIAKLAGESLESGLQSYLSILALISVGLFVINLLPIPLLDGGHLFYYTLEAILRRPLSERTQQFGQRIGLAALALLFSVAIYNDVTQQVLR